MDLAKRDIDIQYLHNLIKDNDKFMSEKHKSLSKLQKDNPLPASTEVEQVTVQGVGTPEGKKPISGFDSLKTLLNHFILPLETPSQI